MFRLLTVAALGASLLTPAGAPTRAPVLVELFTSEGCSSCPPADRVLAALDPYAIVLSEHVDYWDHLGWRDPFSSHASTLRQEAYARIFNTEGPYTPQMVIDGAVQFNGSEGRRAQEEIERASRRERTAVHLARVPAGLEISIDPVPRACDVMLAFAQDAAASQVTAGENRGRSLQHVAILRSLRKIGPIKKGAAFHQTVEIPRDAADGRVIVFAQESGPGRISGAAMLAK